MAKKRKENDPTVSTANGWDMIERDDVVEAIFPPANEQVIELEAEDIMVCLTKPTDTDASLPCLNHGRESAQAWANPWKIVPQDLYHGWNLHLGTIVVTPIEDLDRLGVTGPTSSYYPTAQDAANDYAARLIENVARMVDDKGLHYCVGSSLNAQGEVDDRDTLLERAELVRYLQSKTIKPRYVAISAQRRTMATWIANWLRERDNKHPLRLPCIVRRYESLKALHIAQTDDNRDNSKASYDPAGVISNYILWLDENPMQAAKTLALRAGVPAGTGQRCFALAQLQRQRKLPIVERLRMPPTTKENKIVYEPNGYIHISALDKECCRGLAGQVTSIDSLPAALRSVFVDSEGRFSHVPYQRQQADGSWVECQPTWKPGLMANAAQFETYVRLAMSGSTRSSALDKARVTKLITGLSLDQRCKPVTVGQALRAMLAGNEQFFTTPPSIDAQVATETDA